MSCSTPRPLVGGEIVHDDGLAGREYGDEACLHPILEQGGVDRSEKSLPPLGREGEGRRPKSPFYSDCAGWPPASGARAGNVRVCARDWWRLLSRLALSKRRSLWRCSPVVARGGARRDQKAPDFGGFRLIDVREKRAVLGAEPFAFSASIEDVERWLENRPKKDGVAIAGLVQAFKSIDRLERDTARLEDERGLPRSSPKDPWRDRLARLGMRPVPLGSTS